MFSVVVLSKPALQKLHCFTDYFSTPTPYKEMNMVAGNNKIQERNLKSAVCFKHQFIVLITVTGKLKQEFTLVTAVRNMVAGIIKKSSSSAWHDVISYSGIDMTI